MLSLFSMRKDSLKQHLRGCRAAEIADGVDDEPVVAKKRRIAKNGPFSTVAIFNAISARLGVQVVSNGAGLGVAVAGPSRTQPVQGPVSTVHNPQQQGPLSDYPFTFSSPSTPSQA